MGNMQDYLTPYTRVQASLTSMLTSFYRYTNEDYFCSGLVALSSTNINNGIYYQGTLAKLNDAACKNIGLHFKQKSIIIQTAKEFLENAKKIVDSIQRGQICRQFIENNYNCGAINYAVLLNDNIKYGIVKIFMEYIDKLEQYIETNKSIDREKADLVKLDIFNKEIMTITGDMLTALQNYYSQIINDPTVEKLGIGSAIPPVPEIKALEPNYLASSYLR